MVQQYGVFYFRVGLFLRPWIRATGTFFSIRPQVAVTARFLLGKWEIDIHRWFFFSKRPADTKGAFRLPSFSFRVHPEGGQSCRCFTRVEGGWGIETGRSPSEKYRSVA